METFPQHPQVVTIGGRFGWVLTKVLSEKHPQWQFFFLMRDEAKVVEARKTRQVSRFFSDKIKQSQNPMAEKNVKLPGNVAFYSQAEFCKHFRGEIEILFIPALPSNSLRGALEGFISAGVPLSAFKKCETFSVSKGMENSSLKFAHEVIDDMLKVTSVVGLGGNLAFDLAMGDPMLIELAGAPVNTARIAVLFNGSNLKTLQSRNRRKLGLAGPMKNIHSLATGMGSEIYGNSSVASIATLGLAEYEHAVFTVQFPEKWRSFAHKLQKIPFNFRSVPIGGGAMSDYHLFRFTRNFDAGQQLVKYLRGGMDIQTAIQTISKEKTVESFSSTIPTRDFLKQIGVKTPIIEIVAKILLGEMGPEVGMKKITDLDYE